MAPKIDAKSMKNRGCVFGLFFERLGAAPGGLATLRGHPFWRPFWAKNRKNVIRKGMQNSMPKKYRKLMAKGSQNDAKMDAKIFEKSYFSEKG